MPGMTVIDTYEEVGSLATESLGKRLADLVAAESIDEELLEDLYDELAQGVGDDFSRGEFVTFIDCLLHHRVQPLAFQRLKLSEAFSARFTELIELLECSEEYRAKGIDPNHLIVYLQSKAIQDYSLTMRELKLYLTATAIASAGDRSCLQPLASFAMPQPRVTSDERRSDPPGSCGREVNRSDDEPLARRGNDLRRWRAATLTTALDSCWHFVKSKHRKK